jgi:hypothetical protein
MLGTFPGVADTFTIQTTGIYDLAVRERFSALDSGDHGLRITIGGGGSIIAENDVVVFRCMCRRTTAARRST